MYENIEQFYKENHDVLILDTTKGSLRPAQSVTKEAKPAIEKFKEFRKKTDRMSFPDDELGTIIGELGKNTKEQNLRIMKEMGFITDTPNANNEKEYNFTSSFVDFVNSGEDIRCYILDSLHAISSLADFTMYFNFLLCVLREDAIHGQIIAYPSSEEKFRITVVNAERRKFHRERVYRIYGFQGRGKRWDKDEYTPNISYYCKAELIALGLITKKNGEQVDGMPVLTLTPNGHYLLKKISDNISNQHKKRNNGNPNDLPEALNTILYGPPGTGKTYHTINKSIQICDPSFYEENKDETKREQLKERYKELVDSGQIVFTTFHQSTSYEDFIEGIKPKMVEDENSLGYHIEDGVFKEIAQQAQDQKNAVKTKSTGLEIDNEKFKLPLNKLSLGDANDKEDNAIYEYCIKNDRIVIGFGEEIDFKEAVNIADIRILCQENGLDVNGVNKFDVLAIERFLLWMEIGQLVFISNGNRKLRAIAEITGDYFCDPSAPIRYAQFRKVKWLHKNLEIPIKDLYGKYFSQQTIYQMSGSKIKQSYFTPGNTENQTTKNYVIIIDEINRGNVSSIFGELITLIEDDKREGNDEALSATLPYSKEIFEVPNNLHIIGTMNTADRSVEALDTALRRRFSFQEMLPDSTKLEDKGKGLKVSLKDLLDTINNRIEKLIDRDHTIGHSYLINVNNEQELRRAFQDKIIPLLQEYFFGDYGKIGLVLGSEFVEKIPQKKEVFANFFKYDQDYDEVEDKFDLIQINESFDIIKATQILLKESVA
ncbi:AAA family ATPase [Crocinitomicaceae bacterium]|nr:AAA family ATPase [Crocinitomicaceae bacterium]